MKKERSKQGQTNKQGKATQHTHMYMHVCSFYPHYTQPTCTCTCIYHCTNHYTCTPPHIPGDSGAPAVHECACAGVCVQDPACAGGRQSRGALALTHPRPDLGDGVPQTRDRGARGNQPASPTHRCGGRPSFRKLVQGRDLKLRNFGWAQLIYALTEHLTTEK